MQHGGLDRPLQIGLPTAVVDDWPISSDGMRTRLRERCLPAPLPVDEADEEEISKKGDDADHQDGQTNLGIHHILISPTNIHGTTFPALAPCPSLVKIHMPIFGSNRNIR